MCQYETLALVLALVLLVRELCVLTALGHWDLKSWFAKGARYSSRVIGPRIVTEPTHSREHRGEGSPASTAAMMTLRFFRRRRAVFSSSESRSSSSNVEEKESGDC